VYVEYRASGLDSSTAAAVKARVPPPAVEETPARREAVRAEPGCADRLGRDGWPPVHASRDDLWTPGGSLGGAGAGRIGVRAELGGGLSAGGLRESRRAHQNLTAVRSPVGWRKGT
jgi:hypothetical protein